MASADQLKALLISHIDGDDQHFFSVAMQMAAYEAKLGHGKLAEELRALIDQAKGRRLSQPTPISRPKGDLATLLAVSYPKLRKADLTLEKALSDQLERIIGEQRSASHLQSHGLSPRRKVLLIGPPGTGKTMTASVLAGELGLPLFQVRLDALITKFMGETAAKLRHVFDSTNEARGVYFFDEFDAIGSQRGLSHDVGEIRRILNSFLQMLEQDSSHSMIVAATNHPEILDYALFRRFDDVLHYKLPTSSQIVAILRARLDRFAPQKTAWTKVATKAKGLSHAEIARACDEVIKQALIQRRGKVLEVEILAALRERMTMATKLRISHRPK